MRISLAAVLTALAGLAAAAGAAADPLSIFQPTQIRAVTVTPADARALRALPPLEAFGTLLGTRSPAFDEVAGAREAAASAGYALRLPATLPPGIPRETHYDVTQRAHTTFTFSEAKAAAWAREHNVALHPLPAKLNGTTYSATLAPVAIVTYGTQPRGRRSDRGVRRGSFLAVVQAPLPTVTTDGASLQTLAAWFAAQPGIPPHLAAQVRAIGDPSQTLPIPVQFNKQSATQVSVDGVQGLAIGDQTGIGSAVVWTKDGKLYAVGGTLTQSALLAVANDLR